MLLMAVCGRGRRPIFFGLAKGYDVGQFSERSHANARKLGRGGAISTRPFGKFLGVWGRLVPKVAQPLMLQRSVPNLLGIS